MSSFKDTEPYEKQHPRYSTPLPKSCDQRRGPRKAFEPSYVFHSLRHSQGGKPYIVSNEANRILNASKDGGGYTVMGVTTFRSIEDNDYYDNECEAHAKFKEIVKPRRGGYTVYLIESARP
jgi:hypothetical protein